MRTIWFYIYHWILPEKMIDDIDIDLKDYKLIAGVDEAGRGPLVGAVVAGAVILDPDHPIAGLNDSKKLTAKVPVRFVGNPLVEKARADKDKSTCFNEYELKTDDTVIGLFPGSRQSEIKRVLPILLASADLLIKDKPNLQFILPIASTLNESHFSAHLNQYPHLNVKLVNDLPYNVMQCCDVIITASGTATLEIALMGIPSCIAYKVANLSYYILKTMVKVKYIGLVNIVAEKPIVKEFLQFEAKPKCIVSEINLILDDKNYREKMITELSKVQNKLGKTGGVENMAELILEMLES